jgi:acyl carrier protein
MTDPGIIADPEQVRRMLAGMIAAASDGEVDAADVLAGSHTLSALGLTSLARIRLIDTIEDSFGVDLDLDGDLSSFEHVDTLAAHLADLLATR